MKGVRTINNTKLNKNIWKLGWLSFIVLVLAWGFGPRGGDWEGEKKIPSPQVITAVVKTCQFIVEADGFYVIELENWQNLIDHTGVISWEEIPQGTEVDLVKYDFWTGSQRPGSTALPVPSYIWLARARK